jgi:hypothetical protein
MVEPMSVGSVNQRAHITRHADVAPQPRFALSGAMTGSKRFVYALKSAREIARYPGYYGPAHALESRLDLAGTTRQDKRGWPWTT